MPKNLVARQNKLELEWTAHYNDGTSLKQKYGQGGWSESLQAYKDERHFGHIEQDKLKTFELSGEYGIFTISLDTGEINANGQVLRFKHLDLALTDPRLHFEKRLIYFRRVRNDNVPNGEVIISSRYLLGWQATVNGKNIQNIIIIEADGSLSIMNKR